MPDERPPSALLRSIVALGAVLAVCGVLWWLAIMTVGDNGAVSLGSAERSLGPDATSAGDTRSAVSTAVPALPAPALIDLEPMATSLLAVFDDDMATGSVEFSAVTLNEATGRLMVADDEGSLFEFDLDSNGVPIVPPRRTIAVRVDDSDVEGMAWIAGTTYVLAHEATGFLSVVDIADDQTMIGEAHVLRTIDTQVVEVQGNGIEGVSYVETSDAYVEFVDDVEFLVVVEQPPELLFVDADSSPALTAPLDLGFEDVADVWASPDGSVWVVSDIGRVVVRLVIDNDGVPRQLQRIDLSLDEGWFEQPEGLVINANATRLYVVGEAPGRGQFSLAVWELDS